RRPAVLPCCSPRPACPYQAGPKSHSTRRLCPADLWLLTNAYMRVKPTVWLARGGGLPLALRTETQLCRSRARASRLCLSGGIYTRSLSSQQGSGERDSVHWRKHLDLQLVVSSMWLLLGYTA